MEWPGRQFLCWIKSRIWINRVTAQEQFNICLTPQCTKVWHINTSTEPRRLLKQEIPHFPHPDGTRRGTDLGSAGKWQVRSWSWRGWGLQWCWAGSGLLEGMERWGSGEILHWFPHQFQANRCQLVHPGTSLSAPHSLGSGFAVGDGGKKRFLFPLSVWALLQSSLSSPSVLPANFQEHLMYL